MTSRNADRKSRPQASNLIWTPKDQAAALREGWALFDMDTPRAEIQRDDEAAIFDNDRAARKHVERQEAHGSILHRKALICLGLALAQSRKTNKGWASAALRSAAKGGPSTIKTKPQAERVEMAVCDDCGHRCPIDGLDEYKDFWSRVTVGGIVPAGDCPKCGAFSYIENDAHAGLVEALAKMRSAVAWIEDDADIDEAKRLADKVLSAARNGGLPHE